MALDEIKKPEKDATPKGQDSSKAKESNSNQTPVNFTEAEHIKGIEDAIAQYGDRVKREQINPITKERDTLKSQLGTVQDNAAELEKLQEKFDAMASDDPDKFDVAKELKAAREDRKQLKLDRAVLEEERTTHGEQVKLAFDTLREIDIWNIAAEYETGDPVKLKDLCDTFSTTSQEQIRKVANTLWAKKSTESPVVVTSTLKPNNSKTLGGGKTDQQIIKEYADNPKDKSAKADYVELMNRRARR